MTETKARINDEITASTLRLVADDGEQLGVVSLDEALRIAAERVMDLVEVAPGSNPPVAKLMDYGKFRYQQKKKLRETKKNQTVISVKEIKFRPRTDLNDFEHKVRNLRKFIEEGDKVRVKVFFRGREMVHPEIGEKLIDRVVEEVKDVAKVESAAKMESRQLTAVLAPIRR